MRLWPLNSVQKGKLESQLYKEKRFDYTWFSSDVLREALEVFLDCFDLSSEALEHDLRVTINEEEWGYDSIDEFLSDYRQSTGYCAFVIRSKAGYPPTDGDSFSWNRYKNCCAWPDSPEIPVSFRSV